MFLKFPELLNYERNKKMKTKKFTLIELLVITA